MNNRSRKYRNIDALRTLGCLAIILWHVFANSNYEWGGVIFERIIPSFNYLVYLFMLISGFGMCNGYYDKVYNGSIDVNKFYLRRYKKNVPFFALVVLLDCLLSFSLGTLYEAFIEITMLFGFLPNNNLSVIGVAWTLGVIFVFYIVFPYFVFLIYNKKRAWISLVISLLITYMCQTYFMTDKFVAPDYSMRHSFLYCIPFFVMGGLLYLYKAKIEEIINKYVLRIVIGCIGLTVLYYFIPDQIKGIDVIAFKCLILYSSWLCVALGKTNVVMSNRFTALISGISMEMYLSHMVVFRLIDKIGISVILGNSVIGYICTCLVVIAVLISAILIYKKIVRMISVKIEQVF